MFEKEAEEYGNNFSWTNDDRIIDYSKQGFKDGAEFGYKLAYEEMDYLNKHWGNGKDKANEWHNPKEKLPTKDCEVLIEYDEHKTHRVVDWNNKSQHFGGFSIDEVTRWKEIE